MEEQGYHFSFIRADFRYEFSSVSFKKKVKKVVVFTETNIKNIYNLALLDVLKNGELSDLSETNNEDMVMVLATVIQIIDDFLNKRKDSVVIFRGSDEKRHRLYRIVISRELSKIVEKFEVFGSINSEIIQFVPNKEYDFFLIKKI